MKLSINNIGKLKNAKVEIKGITVIAGENDTGKSTVGKILFSVFNSFYKLDEKIIKLKKNNYKNLNLNTKYKKKITLTTKYK